MSERIRVSDSRTRAALAVGADGIMVEVHCNPSVALSDADQALDEKQYKSLIKAIEVLKPYTLA